MEWINTVVACNDNHKLSKIELEYYKLWDEIQQLTMMILNNPSSKDVIINLIKIKAKRRMNILDLLYSREKFYY